MYCRGRCLNHPHRPAFTGLDPVLRFASVSGGWTLMVGIAMKWVRPIGFLALQHMLECWCCCWEKREPIIYSLSKPLMMALEAAQPGPFSSQQRHGGIAFPQQKQQQPHLLPPQSNTASDHRTQQQAQHRHGQRLRDFFPLFQQLRQYGRLSLGADHQPDVPAHKPSSEVTKLLTCTPPPSTSVNGGGLRPTGARQGYEPGKNRYLPLNSFPHRRASWAGVRASPIARPQEDSLRSRET